jgi:N-acetylglucosaminyldiphosphoundecaprenol N-acetyl-beta-D-mannosaminyltransferase
VEASSTTVIGNEQTIDGIDFNLMSETEVISHVIGESRVGRGGWIATPNVDILCQVRRNPEALRLVQKASLRMPDGMPIIWAGKIMGKPLVERVTGSSLIFTLTQAAAENGLSIYLLGGDPGVPEAAGENLTLRYQGLQVAGTDAPSVGFDGSIDGFMAVRQRLLNAEPKIVYVGLGFPKQERVICELLPVMPSAWFIACGAAITFAAETASRAPFWMQRSGLEWLHRLAKEPRRLFQRYIFNDLPYAIGLLALAVATRIAAICGKKMT